MGRIGCVPCEKSERDFVAQTFDLIAPVHCFLHRVSCSYETIPNAPKHYAKDQIMSLRSNGADWVRSFRKIQMWLHGMSFRINCTSSSYFASSFLQLRNDSKRSQTLCNAPKHEFMVQWSGLGAFIAKKARRDFVAWTFALIAPVHPVLHRVSWSHEIIPNAPKHYTTHKNMSLGSNGADWVRSLRKIRT
jgi:hypothetical protein